MIWLMHLIISKCWFSLASWYEWSLCESCCRVWLFVIPWTAACQASLSITNSQSLLRIMFTEAVIPSNCLILCCPFLLLPPIFPSIRVFSVESASPGQSIGVSASASVLPMNIQDWFPLGLTGLILQSKGFSRDFSNTTVSKASILQHPAFFIVQLSHPFMTTGETIVLTRRTFAGKVTDWYKYEIPY